MSRTLIVHAHPRPASSVVTGALLRALAERPGTTVRSLYALYPDFDIDVAAEQQALADAGLVVWLAPVHWYSVPALLKHWFDSVLVHGWAYGEGGAALRGKIAWWVTSVGGAAAEYSAGGRHGRPFADYVAPVEQVARQCGMRWVEPFVVHAGHRASEAERDGVLRMLRARRRVLQAEQGELP